MFSVHSKRKEKRWACWLVSSIKKVIMLARLDLSNLSFNYIAINKDYKIPESYDSWWRCKFVMISIFGASIDGGMLYNFPESTILPVIQGNFYYTCTLKRVALQYQSFHSNVSSLLGSKISPVGAFPLRSVCVPLISMYKGRVYDVTHCFIIEKKVPSSILINCLVTAFLHINLSA